MLSDVILQYINKMFPWQQSNDLLDHNLISGCILCKFLICCLRRLNIRGASQGFLHSSYLKINNNVFNHTYCYYSHPLKLKMCFVVNPILKRRDASDFSIYVSRPIWKPILSDSPLEVNCVGEFPIKPH